MSADARRLCSVLGGARQPRSEHSRSSHRYVRMHSERKKNIMLQALAWHTSKQDVISDLQEVWVHHLREVHHHPLADSCAQCAQEVPSVWR